MKEQYGHRLTLCYTDTDSFMFYIETEDLYKDMEKNIDMFDTSDYPKDHFLYSEKNKKVLGKMKDEMKSKIIYEFCALRPKCYSYTTETEEFHKAKGVCRAAQRTLRHKMYKKALFENEVKVCSMNVIRSVSHELVAQTIKKRSLVPFDSKCWILEDGITSRPYGHKDNK